MKRALLSIVGTGVLIAGCGSSTKAATTTAAAVATTSAAATTAAPATTAPSAATTAAGASGAAASVAVTEKEFSIAVPASLTAGPNTFTLTNSGSFPHELKVIKADSFDALPKTADGVDEATLGAAVLGKSGKVAGGSSGTLSVTLPAGKYVVVCNLGSGANNHALKGMHVDITVA